MEISTLGLWYVCAFGVAVFAAACPLRPVPIAVGLAAFVATAWWVYPAGVANIPVVALLAAVIAAWALTRSLPPVVMAGAAGILAGAWTGVLGFQGLPPYVGVSVAATLLVASASFAARRRGFAPPALRDEALLFVCAVGVLAAALPSVLDGWRAAGNLALQGEAPRASEQVPMWALVSTGMAATMGGLYSVWSRR